MSDNETKPEPVVVDLAGVRHAVDVLAWARNERLKVEERVKELEDAAKETIKKALGRDGTRGVLDGRPVVNWSKYNKKVFNQKRFREDHPDLFKQYQEDTPSRTFTPVDGDDG